MSLIHKFKQGENYFVLDVNTGSVHIVDELVYDLVDYDKLRPKEELIDEFGAKYGADVISEAYDEIKTLVDEEILYTSDPYEEIAHSSMDDRDYIKAVCLNVIHSCNLRCKYCFADEGEYNGHKGVMSVETAKKAIDYVVKKSGPRKNIEIDLFGGEPTMIMDRIKEIVAYARENEKAWNKNIRFTMTTNATLLTDEMMEYMDEEFENIILSLDGRQEVNDKVRVKVDGSGSYNDILPNIKKMVKKRSKNPLSLREEDLPVIFESYDKLYEEMSRRQKNGEEFNFYHFMVDLNGGPCVYKRISGCGSGFEYVAITPQGDVYPCQQFVGKEEYKLGSIYDDTYDVKLGREFKVSHIYNKPKCKNCWARFYCSGGCQANNIAFNGDMKIPYEVGCKMQKKRIECAIALKAEC